MRRLRRSLGLLLAAATLGGCASAAGDLLVPAPVMAPPRAAEDGASAAAASAPPAIREPAGMPPTPRPAPPVPAAPAAPTPSPAPAPASPTAPAPLATTPPPRTAAIPREPQVLAPQASAEEEQRIKIQAERRIEGTERLVQKIDPSRLAREQQENYKTIQSFLVKAREALSSRDVQRAFTLAEKAYLLADEMSKAPR
jgi:hypothetical protein